MLNSEKKLNQVTKSYKKWKQQTQDTFEFSILVCSAVPVLKRNIILFEKEVISEITKADYYTPKGDVTKERQTQINNDLKGRAVGYKEKLSKYVLISNFSFFESYISDVAKEMIKFHGGYDDYLNKTKERNYFHITNDSADIEKKRKVIRTANKVEHFGHYKSTTQDLDSMGYKFPSDMLSVYGIQMLMQKINNMTSYDIPELLKNGFFVDLSDSEIEAFHNIRQERNKIAHGEPIALSIGQVTDMCRSMSEIAKKVDQHLLRYFFISEDYRKK